MNRAVFFKHPRLLFYASEEVMAWAAHQLRTRFREPSFGLGVLNGEGHLVGAVIYNDLDARNVEMTIVGPRGAFFKDVSREIFSYAFDHLGCRRVSLTIPETHQDVIRQAMKWGWKVEGRKRDYYDDDNAIILGMLRVECRFLKRSSGSASAKTHDPER